MLFLVGCFGACKDEYDPEMIVRNTCFDQYNSFSDGYEMFEGQLFGYVVGLLVKDSFVFTSQEEGIDMWDEEWAVNEDIQWFDDIVDTYDFDCENEDLLCVTLSEHIDYEDDSASSYSCVFSINKSSKEVLPIQYFTTKNGEIDADIVDGAENSISAFYMMTKYMISDLENLRENVYDRFN